MDKKLQSGLLAVIAVCATIICILMLMSNNTKEQITVSSNNGNQQIACVHVWSQSTCTKSQKCNLCGIETGSPRGHQWLDATATDPMRCSVCGQTKGEIKEYSGGSYGTMSQEWISFSKWDVHPYIMSVKVENCVSFSMTLSIWNVEYGSPYGTWEVYCKDKSGNWTHVEDVDIQKNMTTIEICLDEPMSFTEIAVNRASTKGCKHSYEINVNSYCLYIE